MAVRNQNWYDLNESRSYPIDETAILVDDDGYSLPTHIICDLQLRFPSTAGNCAYISGLTVTPTLVSLTIVGSSSREAPDSLVPLAAVTLLKPVTRFRTYSLQPLYPGVSGWIVIGGGQHDEYTGRFSSPAQSRLLDRIARPYESPPIPDIAKVGSSPLTGYVHLRSGSDLSIRREYRVIPGFPPPEDEQVWIEEEGDYGREVIVIGLKDVTERGGRNVLDIYRGKCGARPESQTCEEHTPIEFIGNVAPDCCGAITIQFRGCANIAPIEFASVGPSGTISGEEIVTGVIVDCDLPLEDACSKSDIPDAEGRLPYEYDDLCESISVSEVTVPIPDEEPSFSIDDEEASASAIPELPFEDDFSSADANWVVRSGIVNRKQLPDTSWVLHAEGEVRNSIVYEEEWGALYRRVEAIVEIDSEGFLRKNAQLILNHKVSEDVHRYWAITLDQSGHLTEEKSLGILFFNGTNWSTMFRTAVDQLTLDSKYRLEAEIYPKINNDVWVIVKLEGIDQPEIDVEIGPLTLYAFLPETGYFGFGSHRASAYCHEFKLENTAS